MGRSPLKLFESWACGVPFVTADVGDRKQLLGSPPAGVLAQPGDENSLASGILQILNSPTKGETIGRLGQERVEPYYWDKLVELLETAYVAKADND